MPIRMFVCAPFHHAGNPMREPFRESIALWTEPAFGLSRSEKGVAAPLFWLSAVPLVARLLAVLAAIASSSGSCRPADPSGPPPPQAQGGHCGSGLRGALPTSAASSLRKERQGSRIRVTIVEEVLQTFRDRFEAQRLAASALPPPAIEVLIALLDTVHFPFLRPRRVAILRGTHRKCT